MHPQGSASSGHSKGRTARGRRRAIRLRPARPGSPIARRILLFNISALILLVAGVLYLDPFRDALVQQHERSLLAEAQSVADLAAEPLLRRRDATADGLGLQAALRARGLARGASVAVFDRTRHLVASLETAATDRAEPQEVAEPNTILLNLTRRLGTLLSRLGPAEPPAPQSFEPTDPGATDMAAVFGGTQQVVTGSDPAGRTVVFVATPVMAGGGVVGTVALRGTAGAVDRLLHNERKGVLQMFVVALLVSIGLSLILAGTIATPLAQLAAAADFGRDTNARKLRFGRVQLPDLSARSDEIGRLSGALRGMVAALYHRIEANERFASDVAHEVKNPLASLRSAVGTLRIAEAPDQRARLLDLIDHDVRRLDRLVSDISSASRLDSELVTEEEERFDLLALLGNIADTLEGEARSREIDMITDFPAGPIIVQGLEPRIAQVFLNLIGNAISFCTAGDAVRLWVRRRDNRVLTVVEDTGPGIPESALTAIFDRFYSERSAGQFGEHSGLGLAIARQIVEAHGGVVCAENIQPGHADVTSDPFGARFIVGLPL